MSQRLETTRQTVSDRTALERFAANETDSHRPSEGDDRTPNPEATRIRGFSAHSETTIHGKSAIFFGVPFLSVGVFITAMILGEQAPKGGDIDVPNWVLSLFGVIFAVPGLCLMAHGVRGMIRDRRIADLRDRHTADPWVYDYNWSEDGVRDTQARGVRQVLFGFLFVSLFALPFNLIAIESGNGYAMAFVFSCVDFFVAVYAIAFMTRLTRWMKFGTARLQFRRFPFRVGEKIDLEFVPARGLNRLTSLACTLRCVREAYETRQVGNRTRTEIVGYEMHQQTVTFDTSALATADRGVTIRFDIPDDAPTTQLSQRPPIYWQLEVKGEAPGSDLHSKFIVPVYARA